MAHFRATIQGSRGQASRVGGKNVKSYSSEALTGNMPSGLSGPHSKIAHSTVKTRKEGETMEANEYETQAREFCGKYHVIIESTYTGHRPYFEEDATARACFSVTITREGKTPYTFNYGQSLAKSYQARDGYGPFFGKSMWGGVPHHFPLHKPDKFPLPVSAKEEKSHRYRTSKNGPTHEVVIRQAIIPPTEYDVLAALTKYDPGTFDDFCADYGYSTDSRKAEQAYFAVQKEWSNVIRLFADCMDDLAEIN